MYYFYSVLCNRIRHNCCCCGVWLIIQIMYSPANRVFLSQNAAEVVSSWSCAHNVPFNTFYMQCILGVIIIIWLKTMTIIKLYFIFSHLMCYCYFFFLNGQIKCFFFPQKFCVVYLVIKGRHKTSISFIFTFLKMLLFLADKQKLLLKLKPVGNVVWSFLTKCSFHNFSSMYILLNILLRCLQKNGLLFWRVAVNTFTFLCN